MKKKNIFRIFVLVTGSITVAVWMWNTFLKKEN